jgi:sulfur-carrier protein
MSLRVVGSQSNMALVRLRGPLKTLAGGGEHHVAGATVGELLVELERTNPPLDGWILDERDRIRRHINVFVNGERGDAETRVAGGDEVDVLPAITGGSA